MGIGRRKKQVPVLAPGGKGQGTVLVSLPTAHLFFTSNYCKGCEALWLFHPGTFTNPVIWKVESNFFFFVLVIIIEQIDEG